MIGRCNRDPGALDIEIGARIRQRRQAARISLSKLAPALSVSVRRLRDYEAGHRRFEPKLLALLAGIFNVPLSYFFVAPAVDYKTFAKQRDGKSITISRANSISYLPVMIMQRERLVERIAASEGLDIEVLYNNFDTGARVVSDLIEGRAQFGAGVSTAFLSAWDKHLGNEEEIRAICALSDAPLYLLTRNPTVKSLADFTELDRINVILPKIAIQAIVLEMAVAKQFGMQERAKFDPLTVGLLAPEAANSLIAGTHRITSDFCSPPFSYKGLENPELTKILESRDVFGEQATFSLLFTTAKFYKEQPRLVAVVRAAVDAAIALIASDRQAAAETFQEITDSRWAFCTKRMLDDPEITFQTAPHGLMQYATFMHEAGYLQRRPGKWQDCFFPNEAVGLFGS